MKKVLKPYVLNKKFGEYYLPVRFQNKLMKLYCDEKSLTYSLSTGEIVFGKNYIQLRTLINKLKKNEGILFMSLNVLPIDYKLRSSLIERLKKKGIECHFVFENLVIKNKRDFSKINEFFKLRKFTK
tara:strand:- start:111 stop:491 length:381 start_codon:yes stop_codon:yes gene_type:complete